MSQENETPGLALGILSLILWLFPPVGLILSIIGLTKASPAKYTTGIVLNSIGLGLSVVNMLLGILYAVG